MLSSMRRRTAGVRVQKARGSVPTNTDEFATRITDLAARINDLKGKLTQSAQQQQQYLEHLASQALLGEKGPPRGVPSAGALRACGYLRSRERAAGTIPWGTGPGRAGSP